MRKVYLLSIVALLLLSSCGNSHINNFYNKYRWKKGTVNFTVPGWMIWTATGFINEGTNDPEMKTLMKFAKKVKQIKFLVSEDGERISKPDVDRLVKNLRSDNFEDMFFIKDGNTTVSMMMQEKNDKIKNLFFVVKDDGEFVMINMKTKLKIEEINKMIRIYRKEQEKENKNPKVKIPPIPKIPLKRV